MRKQITIAGLEEFIRALGSTKVKAQVYLVGGASAVMLGWRDSTIDIDLKLVPESDELLRSLPVLKERLQLNVELAAPDDFIPALPGWQERSLFIQQQGTIDFFHYDFYAQALAKIERDHALDRQDVQEMIKRGLVKATRLLELFNAIEDQLFRYPAINGPSFRRAVEQVADGTGDDLTKRV